MQLSLLLTDCATTDCWLQWTKWQFFFHNLAHVLCRVDMGWQLNCTGLPTIAAQHRAGGLCSPGRQKLLTCSLCILKAICNADKVCPVPVALCVLCFRRLVHAEARNSMKVNSLAAAAALFIAIDALPFVQNCISLFAFYFEKKNFNDGVLCAKTTFWLPGTQ